MTITGFQSNSHDFALFLQCTNCGTIILLLYVDDIIITNNDLISIEELKHFFTTQFDMKNLSVLGYFLGFEISSSLDVYLLN